MIKLSSVLGYFWYKYAYVDLASSHSFWNSGTLLRAARKTKQKYELKFQTRRHLQKYCSGLLKNYAGLYRRKRREMEEKGHQ